MAISINVRMTRGEWSDFADWLDARYTAKNWHFYGRYGEDHADMRFALRERKWEQSETLRAFYVGPTASVVGNTIVLRTDDDAAAFALIKIFHGSATVQATDVEFGKVYE